MTEHRLERLHVANAGTFGQLKTAGGRVFHSMERLWANNEPRVSCVPAGRYQLVPWESKKFPRARALVGNGVALVPGMGVKRSAILIHAANRPIQLMGCIALGLDYSEPGILARSRIAVGIFIDELDATPGPHWLEIIAAYKQ